MSNKTQIHRFLESHHFENLKHFRHLDSEEGTRVEFPLTLDSELVEILRGEGVESLYSHQAEAFENISNGNDTVIVSKTASGKTFSFLLPILNQYKKDLR